MRSNARSLHFTSNSQLLRHLFDSSSLLNLLLAFGATQIGLITFVKRLFKIDLCPSLLKIID
jgi:hypothetical protein